MSRPSNRRKRRKELVDEFFGLEDLDQLLDDNELGNIFEDVGKGFVKGVETVGKGIVEAAKWTAGAITTVLDSTPFKIVFPVRLIIDNPIARKIGAQIPIVGQALAAEDKAKALLNKIASGQNVTDELMNAGKTAVAQANELSAKAKTAILNAPGGAVLRDQLIEAAKTPQVFKGATKQISGIGDAFNAALAKGIAAATGAPPPPSSTTPKSPAGSSTNSAAKMALAAPVPMAVPASSAQQPVINVTVAPYPQSSNTSRVIQPSRIDAADLTSKIEAKFGPQFKAVTDTLERISLQNQATTEHNDIVDKTAWQRRVIDSLKRISTLVG